MTTLGLDFGTYAKEAVADLAATFKSLGQEELASAAVALEQYAPAAARWEVHRQQAQASGDAAALAQVESSFDALKANAALRLADAGVLGQSAIEAKVLGLLNLIGKLALSAALGPAGASAASAVGGLIGGAAFTPTLPQVPGSSSPSPWPWPAPALPVPATTLGTGYRRYRTT